MKKYPQSVDILTDFHNDNNMALSLVTTTSSMKRPLINDLLDSGVESSDDVKLSSPEKDCQDSVATKKVKVSGSIGAGQNGDASLNNNHQEEPSSNGWTEDGKKALFEVMNVSKVLGDQSSKHYVSEWLGLGQGQGRSEGTMKKPVSPMAAEGGETALSGMSSMQTPPATPLALRQLHLLANSPSHQSSDGEISLENSDPSKTIVAETNEGQEAEGHEVCPECHKVFKRKIYLQRHMEREHWSTAKVFKCDDCNYETKHQSNLSVHRRTHTGERPYHCGACGQRYTQGHLLKSHIRSRHHGNMEYYNLDKKSDSTRGRKSLDIKHDFVPLHRPDKISTLLQAAAAAGSQSTNNAKNSAFGNLMSGLSPYSLPYFGLQQGNMSVRPMLGSPLNLGSLGSAGLFGSNTPFLTLSSGSTSPGQITSGVSLAPTLFSSSFTRAQASTGSTTADSPLLLSTLAAGGTQGTLDLHLSPPQDLSKNSKSHVPGTGLMVYGGGSEKSVTNESDEGPEPTANIQGKVDDAKPKESYRIAKEINNATQDVSLKTWPDIQDEDGKNSKAEDDIYVAAADGDVESGGSSSLSSPPPRSELAADVHSACLAGCEDGQHPLLCPHSSQLVNLRKNVMRMLQCLAPEFSEVPIDYDSEEVDQLLHEVMFSNIEDLSGAKLRK